MLKSWSFFLFPAGCIYSWETLIKQLASEECALHGPSGGEVTGVLVAPQSSSHLSVLVCWHAECSQGKLMAFQR